MIQRFRFGLPLPTDSVVQEIPVSAGPVPFLTAEEDGWAYRMAPDAIVYGLGENAPRHQQARLALRDQQHR